MLFICSLALTSPRTCLSSLSTTKTLSLSPSCSGEWKYQVPPNPSSSHSCLLLLFLDPSTLAMPSASLSPHRPVPKAYIVNRAGPQTSTSPILSEPQTVHTTADSYPALDVSQAASLTQPTELAAPTRTPVSSPYHYTLAQLPGPERTGACCSSSHPNIQLTQELVSSASKSDLKSPSLSPFLQPLPQSRTLPFTLGSVTAPSALPPSPHDHDHEPP